MLGKLVPIPILLSLLIINFWPPAPSVMLSQGTDIADEFEISSNPAGFEVPIPTFSFTT
ncbi:hypothetical protein HYT56_00575 [Candidatus Woesearchaeota archaeon]|nr:hypothetical protein [Candidatus Woesearchaeota archaeon]